MKKIICIILALALIFGLCSCSASSEESKERIGYVIIPHADGDEYADIYRYITNYGNICAYCLDGRKIVSSKLIIVEEN